MDLRIGFAFNEKTAEEEEPPSGEPPHTGSHDRYAEWDDPDTINAVHAALGRLGQVIRLKADADFPQKLHVAQPDIVFNVAEGLFGPNREAHVPAICEFYDVAYTGSDPLSLCLALDKERAKEAFRARGVLTPAWIVATPASFGASSSPGVEDLTYPVIVKPLYEGSSKGIPNCAYCTTAEAARRRIAEVHEEYAQPALVEEFLPGREFTVAILGNSADARMLPPVEILFDSLPAGAAALYGYEAKWLWDTPDAPLQMFECPAAIDDALEDAIEAAALGAYHALGCRDWSRVDLRLDARGIPQVLEINPLPGILPRPEQNSCFPKAARAAGMSYDDLICSVVEIALVRYGRVGAHA